MATVHRIEGEFVSAFVNYPPKDIETELNKFLNSYRDDATGLGLESINIKVERK